MQGITKDEYYKELISRHEEILKPTENAKKDLSEFKFGITGLGGIGTSTALALTRLGAKNIVIVDPDKVELNNLNRQPYISSDIGLNKAKCVEKKIKAINPYINLEVHPIAINSENISTILKNCDLIVEVVDHYPIKALISRFCEKLDIPYGHAASMGFIGNVTLFVPDGPSYEKLFDLPSLNRRIEDVRMEEWEDHKNRILKAVTSSIYSKELIDRLKGYSTPWPTMETPGRTASQILALESMKYALGYVNNLIIAPKLLRLNTLVHKYEIITFKTQPM